MSGMTGADVAATPGPGVTGLARLDYLVTSIIESWPQHARFLRGSFEGYGAFDLERLDCLAERVLQLVCDNLDAYVASSGVVPPGVDVEPATEEIRVTAEALPALEAKKESLS